MEQIDVRILDRDYRLAVPSEEKDRLLKAVELVDTRMKAIRSAGRVSALERIAVMAALQLANDLIGAAPATAERSGSDTQGRVRRMAEMIDEELQRQSDLFAS